ncbi:transcriptional regulator [Aeromicrobium erythreum]|uniref:Winged helix DNA-binding domain-containing protein n=1 Tax=Aeromicrobium erythreum TaxID=2041 RepID=A0A0U4B8X8_9ACTN|nr:transcriptional regulator [Aeromicrobium erythreum]ALX04292.1 hypothetical protein AERYTH_06060 [Aeromicrobium erythreum]
MKVAAFLAGCDEAEFGTVAAQTSTSASVLSKAATALEDAGYVRVRKGHVGRRPRTWLCLTEEGRAAYSAHLRALEDLTALARTSTGATLEDS